MLVKYINIDEIEYQKTPFDDDLKSSIASKGILINLRVNKIDGGYQCVDGHKRLSCIIESGIDIKRVPCLILNDFSKQGSTYWGNRRIH